MSQDAATATFPPEFADLEPWAAWALPTENERFAKRIASSMDELQAFYDAAFPRLAESVEHLKGLQLTELTEQESNLLRLFEALVTASFPVEVWRQPRVPDSGASSFDAVVQPPV
jgi:hypothetical protein